MDNVVLRDYQKEAIQKVKDNKGRLLLNMPCGSGKSWTAIFLKHYYPFIQKVLVLCPSSIKAQWKQEINRIFPNDEVIVLRGHYQSGFADSIFCADWIVINYDILAESNPKYLMWSDVLSRIQFDLVIIDESHYISSPSALRTQAVQKIVNKIKNRVLLSGTPISTNLENLYTQLNLVDPVKFTTEKEYKNKYCTYILKKIHARGKTIRFNELQPPTQQQIQLLKNDMKDDVYFVSKEVVYAHLPETTYVEVPYSENYNDMRNEINALISYSDDSSKAKATFADAMLKLGEIKLDFTVDFCKQLNDVDDRKVCIVAYNRSIVEELNNRLKSSSVFFYGGMKDSERQKAVSEFINNPEIKFFIMNSNTITGLDGLNTVCSTIVFCQIPYTWSVFSQCVGRVKRANSTFDKYFAYTIIAENDLDKAVYSTMIDRKNVAEALFESENAVDTDKTEQSFIRDVLKKLKR